MPARESVCVGLWPLPRAVQLLLVPLLALVSVAPGTVGAPLVPDALHGGATATTFQIIGHGAALEGGAFDWTNVCGLCLIRMTISTPGIRVADAASAEGPVRELVPGQYEVREYRGLFGIYEIGPRDYVVALDGLGKVHRLG